VDPVDFLVVAGRLRASEVEAERRTSVGRSYYGLYNLLSECFRVGANLQGNGADHGRLIRYLSQSSDGALQKAGERLKNLKSLRQDADYRMNLVMGAGESELAYRLAREALTAVQKTPSTR
jgi:hypothetical protein